MNKLKNSGLFVISLGLAFLLISQMTLGFSQVDFQSYQTVDKPTDIIWVEGGFIVATGESGIRLYKINPRTEEVTLFSPTFKGGDEVHMASTLGPNFPSGTVFANQNDKIFLISPDGQTVRDLSTPIEGINIAGLSMDLEKYWNYNLIAATYDGSIWEVDQNGKTDLIVNLGSGAIPNGIVIAPSSYGDFSGHILVSLKNENKIVAISNIDHTVSDFQEFQGETPGLLIYNFRDSTLYASNTDENKIISLNKEITLPWITQIMLVTEDEQDSSLSLKFIRSTRLGIEISELASGISNKDISDAVFVGDSAFDRALEVPAEEVAEIDSRLIIFPVFAIIVVGGAVLIWKYRGF
ncbi:hypothetical protein ACFL96_09755 [Thermoproteota archaeon]